MASELRPATFAHLSGSKRTSEVLRGAHGHAGRVAGREVVQVMSARRR